MLKKIILILSLVLIGGAINSSYAQYRDGSGKKKRQHKKRRKPIFRKSNSYKLKPGENPFSGRPQKNHRTDINESPFATKKREKDKNKNKNKRRKHQGEPETKSRYSNKRPKKKLGKKEKSRY